MYKIILRYLFNVVSNAGVYILLSGLSENIMRHFRHHVAIYLLSLGCYDVEITSGYKFLYIYKSFCYI